MPESWEHSHWYDSPWASVVLAFSLRYPSPTALHIISVDVLSRTVNVSSNVVTTERLILKRGAASALPKWFPARMLGKTESWIYERSESDLDDRVLRVWTRNLDHKTVMDVREDLVVHERDSSNPLAGTSFDTSVNVISELGFGYLRAKVENFGVNRFKLATERSRNAIGVLVELLGQRQHRENLLSGRPAPLSAMLAPAFGESQSRWEELGSGFSGHGFDDRERERFDFPDNLHAKGREEVESRLLSYKEWIQGKRAESLQKVSDNLRGVRQRWFGWRLQMKQVDESRDITAASDKDSDDDSQQNGSATRQGRKTWVWAWSRNK